MKTFILLIVAFIFIIITDQTNGFIAKRHQFIDDDVAAEDENHDNQLFWLKNADIPSSFDRRSESAERYFDWASKTQRPVEYFRGKRFWLFTKKDDTSSQQDSVSSNTLGQGIWRSGIVGKR